MYYIIMYLYKKYSIWLMPERKGIYNISMYLERKRERISAPKLNDGHKAILRRPRQRRDDAMTLLQVSNQYKQWQHRVVVPTFSDHGLSASSTTGTGDHATMATTQFFYYLKCLSVSTYVLGRMILHNTLYIHPPTLPRSLLLYLLVLHR